MSNIKNPCEECIVKRVYVGNIMITTWYHKTEKCIGCMASLCKTPPEYYDGKNLHERKLIKCPCTECIVKPICNSYCEEYHVYAQNYHDKNLKQRGGK